MMQFLMSRLLTTKGLTDAQIQLISGHESKKSLEGIVNLTKRVRVYCQLMSEF